MRLVVGFTGARVTKWEGLLFRELLFVFGRKVFRVYREISRG